MSGGFIWQRGLPLEISTEASSARIASGGHQFDRDRVRTAVVYHWSRGARLSGELAYERDRGFVPSTIRTASLGVEAHIGPRLVAHGAFVGRSELDLGLVEEDYRVGLTLFARRHSFDRGGEAATQTLAVARRATAMGYNERRVHTLDGRRALRERLSLSANRQELADEIEALYQAQVRDRNVPHTWGLNGLARKTRLAVRYATPSTCLPVYRGGLGGHSGAATTPSISLVFGFSHIEDDFIQSSYERHYRAEVVLNRETSIAVVWIDPEQTRLEDTLGRPVSQRWETRLVYQLGR